MGTKIKIGSEEVTGGFTLIPVGRWKARLMDVHEEISSSGNPMLNWDWEMIEGEPGAEITLHASLLENALSNNKQVFTAFGKSWKSGDDLEKLAKKFIKQIAVLSIVHDTFNNRNTGEEMKSNKINGIYSKDTATGASGGANALKKKSDNNPFDDDEIPF